MINFLGFFAKPSLFRFVGKLIKTAVLNVAFENMETIIIEHSITSESEPKFYYVLTFPPRNILPFEVPRTHNICVESVDRVNNGSGSNCISLYPKATPPQPPSVNVTPSKIISTAVVKQRRYLM